MQANQKEEFVQYFLLVGSCSAILRKECNCWEDKCNNLENPPPFLLLSLSFYCWAQCDTVGLLFGQLGSAVSSGSSPSPPSLLTGSKMWEEDLLLCKLCSRAVQSLLRYQHCFSCQFKAQNHAGELVPPQPVPVHQGSHRSWWVRHRTGQSLQPSEAADECQVGRPEAAKAKINSYFRHAYVSYHSGSCHCLICIRFFPPMMQYCCPMAIPDWYHCWVKKTQLLNTAGTCLENIPECMCMWILLSLPVTMF